MCLLIMYHGPERLDPSRRHTIRERLGKLIDHARVEHRPVAYMRENTAFGFHTLGLDIGRYEPIFGVFQGETILPDGLIDFIVKSKTPRISLAGFADWAQFEAIKSVLSRAGLEADIEAEAITPD
jgi:hypothetical protein